MKRIISMALILALLCGVLSACSTLEDGDKGAIIDVYFTDENGNTYQSLNDSTHYFGAELEQHVLQDANGNGVTVTETTNGDYYYMDDNCTCYIDNGDGTWTDENGNSYTE